MEGECNDNLLNVVLLVAGALVCVFTAFLLIITAGFGADPVPDFRSRHPSYNPEKEGRNIKGACSTCWDIYNLFHASVELERSVRDFLRRAEAWAVTRQSRKQNSRSDASEERNKGEPPVSSGNCGGSRDRVVVVGPAYSFLNHQEIPTSLLWFQTKV